MSLDSELLAALNQRREQNRYRSRFSVESPQGVELCRNGKTFLSFCSNDYLGLANHPKVVERFQHAARRYGVGSGASHLVCGHSDEHHQLEQELAEFTGRPRALLFSTGYMANMGVINALAGRGDTVYEDRLNHASLLDGGLLSAAQFVRYKHNDMVDLEKRIQKQEHGRKLIVVDGVFSMDGDLADLPALSHLAKQYNAHIMVDDAHGFGCLGEGGRGTVNHYNCSDDIPILMGTLGKAFGTFGAFIAGSEVLIESLIQFSRTYIYTTALPPAVAAATRASLQILANEQERRERLNTLIHYFRKECEGMGLSLMPSRTPIQPVVIGDEQAAVTFSQRLAEKGIWVTAIRPPTVPEGSSRLRVTLTSEHSLAHVDRLLEALHEVQRGR